jgi:peptide/nickel transport system permease protein
MPPATHPAEDELISVAVPSATPKEHRRRRPWWVAPLVSYLVMVFALITLNFFLPRAMPGDPIESLLARGVQDFHSGEETKAALTEYYGLDKPLLTQYVDYLGNLAQGDLGRSIISNEPVTDELARRVPWTVLLISTSLALAAAIGIFFGVQSGWKRDRPIDRALMTGLLTVREFPPMLLGSLALFLFSVKLGWFEVGRTESADISYNFVGRVFDILWHLTLPMLVLTAGLAVGFYLRMRAGMVTELGSDYLLLGRAKGLRPRRLKYRYAARNALLPVVTNGAIEIGFAVTANIIVESVFSYPGLGELMISGAAERDYPRMQGAFLVFSLGVVTVNALADVVSRRLDRRITA